MKTPPKDDWLDDGVGPVSYLRMLGGFWSKLRRHYRLLVALLGVFMALGVLDIILAVPQYTATSTIAAAHNTLDKMTSMDVGGLGSSLAQGLGRSLLGGAGGGGDFDEYQELLTSNRLASVIMRDPNVLHAIFCAQYDWDRHAWKSSGGVVRSIKDFLKSLIHYPIKSQPDMDDLNKYLSQNILVDAPLTSSFVTVSLDAETPAKAAWLLSVVLRDADTIIREERRKDVTARIQYLTKTLPTVTQTDQREALSAILSQQQQTMMTVEADARYASTIVDPPYAPLKPTSPKIATVIGVALLLAAAVWAVLVYWLQESHWLLALLSRPIWPRLFGKAFPSDSARADGAVVEDGHYDRTY